MPERDRIHSSVVSMRDSNSALVDDAGGQVMPDPDGNGASVSFLVLVAGSGLDRGGGRFLGGGDPGGQPLVETRGRKARRQA